MAKETEKGVFKNHIAISTESSEPARRRRIGVARISANARRNGRGRESEKSAKKWET